MRSPSSTTRLRGTHRDPYLFRTGLIIAISALSVPGCEEETRHVATKAETRALDQTGIAVGDDENPQGQIQHQPPAQQSGPIIGRRTTDIRNATDELKKGGAQVASTKIVRKTTSPSRETPTFQSSARRPSCRSSTPWIFTMPPTTAIPRIMTSS